MNRAENDHALQHRSPALDGGRVDATVVEIVRIKEPDQGEGRRHVVVRWSDGVIGRALSYFPDEVLISEGEMIGRTASELRTVHFARDREYLQGTDRRHPGGRE
ncbi:MAG: hypothetical protein V7607_6719 [Solirubrobacteraceae bacterium]